MTLDKPRVMIVQEDLDANTMLAGLLWLKGYEVHKASTQKNAYPKLMN